MKSQSILWRRLDQPGHESARLRFHKSLWQLEGAAVFEQEEQPCRLDYLVICDAQWRTVSGKVVGWLGGGDVEIDILSDAPGRWRIDGAGSVRVEGCIDLDLEFSPATNLIPIRRLNLAIGAEARARTAWLRFPALVLEPLDQLYRRINDTTYHYQSGEFVTELSVSRDGFITLYPDFWEAQA